jgi:conjugative relaxase-like TrwC/TraI family protein
MFNPGKLSGHNAEKYFDHLGRTDGYYCKNEEPPGRWHGQGAAELGLDGRVKGRDFKQVMNGRLGDRQLVANAGAPGRVKAWDCPVAPPRSVSVAYAVGSPDTRAAIKAAHTTAMRAVIERMEATVETRAGQGGKHKTEGARLVVGEFFHDTNRANEPSIHSHLVCMNIAVRGDGSTATPVFRGMLREQKSIGALYRVELARALSREGFDVQACEGVDEKGRKYQSFELANVPPALTAAFSKRSDEIKQAAAEKGISRSLENRKTREKKKEIPRAELDRAWLKTAAAVLGTEAAVDFRRAPGVEPAKTDLRKLDVSAMPKSERDRHYEREAANRALRGERAAAGGGGFKAPSFDPLPKAAVAGAAKGLAALIAAAQTKSQPSRPQKIEHLERALERKFDPAEQYE